MKLYATTKSERATKGQGGNKEIVITLIIDPVKHEEVGRVVMRYGEACEGDHAGYTIFYYPISEHCKDQKINSGRVLLYQTKKGEKQKSELLCGNCKTVTPHDTQSICAHCGSMN